MITDELINGIETLKKKGYSEDVLAACIIHNGLSNVERALHELFAMTEEISDKPEPDKPEKVIADALDRFSDKFSEGQKTLMALFNEEQEKHDRVLEIYRDGQKELVDSIVGNVKVLIETITQRFDAFASIAVKFYRRFE